MSIESTLLINTTTAITVSGLKIRNAPANSAIVQVTLYESDGDEVEGETWPVTLGYVANSKGVYEGELSADINVDEGGKYEAVIVATQDGNKRTWYVPLVAAKGNAC